MQVSKTEAVSMHDSARPVRLETSGTDKNMVHTLHVNLITG